ncbi:MAG: VOC family protein [Limnohabitans sp.]|jgi:catechol 2,3-dioxygenase
MKSPWISALRSVALTVPDLAAAEIFYTETWGLVVAEKSHGVAYFRGSGHDHHVLALHEAAGTPQLRLVTLRARSAKSLEHIAQAAIAAGGVVERTGAAFDPAGGQVVVIRDPDGRRIEIVHGDAQRANDVPVPQDRPIRLAHAVLNSHAVEKTREFFEQALGFVLADRTRIMAFMNCDNDHHSIALGDTDNDALNHVAFLMPTLDAVMRGGGRLKDKGLPPQWGPGRHGPGDNAFNYFVDPFGIVIEYTAEVEQIDATYRVGRPEDWTWPPGRIDQWGIGQMPTDHLKQAQRRVFFMPHLD